MVEQIGLRRLGIMLGLRPEVRFVHILLKDAALRKRRQNPVNTGFTKSRF